MGLIGGAAAAWPFFAVGQQAIPAIGFLYGAGPDTSSDFVASVQAGLGDSGFHVGRNVIIEYRWGQGQPDRLPAMAAELVAKGVSVIVAGPTVAALAAKTVTSTVPIVFITSDNPVKFGLVQSVNRPGANMTGVNFLGNEIGTKQLDFLRELVPAAKKIGLLVNPGSPPGAAASVEVQTVAQKLGYQIQVEHVRIERDVEQAFAALSEWQADAAMVIADGLMRSMRDQLSEQAAQRKIPTVYPLRDYVLVGGLISYGTSVTEAFRQMGVYAGRILKGEKPADLPVVQSAKFEMVVNLKAAKRIGLTVPTALLLRADEVLE